MEGLRKARLLVLGISVAAFGCSRSSDETHDLKAAYYPLDLALTCDQSTPSPLRSEHPVHDMENAFGTSCTERDSGVNAVTISEIDIHRNAAFRDTVYEIHLHIDQKDWRRVDVTMSKAMQSRRILAYVVNGAVVAHAVVMGVTHDGDIEMGGYDSVKEAEVMASRFEIPRARKSGAKGGIVN